MSQVSNTKKTFVAIVLAILLLLISYFSRVFFFEYSRFTALGSFGEWFNGMLSPIISGFTLYYVYSTYKSQKTELDSNKSFIKKQQFENIFFKWITIHNEIVSGIQFRNNNQELSGKKALNKLFDLLKSQYDRSSSNDISLEEDKIKIMWKAYYDEYGRLHLGHYFRNLYHIVKFIDESDLIIEKDRNAYIRILRAQLSASEFMLIYYNVLGRVFTVNDYEFKNIIDKYNLLHNKSDTLLFNISHNDIWEKMNK